MTKTMPVEEKVLKDSAMECDGKLRCAPRVQHRFLVLRKLGQGTYGKVQLALNKETNEEVAIKTIKKAKIVSEEDMLRIRREIQIMASIRHPHIIHINEVFETKQKIVLVMQYASGGELYDYLGCHRTLPEDEARRIFRQIASAIYYCHKNKICHRDLKLENILLDEEGNAQIADFGLSNIFDERRRMNTFCGSPLYASPEIVKGTPYKGPEVDCWSLGVLLYTLIYGTMPFDGRNFKDLVTQISEGRYEEPIMKSNASGLIRRLLTPEIAKRATIFDVCIDRWVNQGYTEPLVKVAEKMTSEALLKTRKLGAPKIYSEGTNEIKERLLPSIISTEQNKENVVVQEKTEDSKNVRKEESQKDSLFEQMLKYDVGFVVNQLLSAVESAKENMQNNDKNASQCENVLSSFKPKINGENGGKVESAYVIPIFEVTSTMPKLNVKNSKPLDCGQISQPHIPQSAAPVELQHNLTSEKKVNKPKTKRKTSTNINQSATFASNCKAMENGVGIVNQGNDLDKQSNLKKKLASIEIDQAQLFPPNENMLPRIPSVKMKKPQENHLLFGQKKPFFRSKNNSLSLARIFSMKYERLVLDALKVPERKQKPPGKITIPATFDPATACDETPERKEIVILFPTVSVSENKEKIEKKIDKIKKAALNMKLIRRSNTNNRLRIEKFLRSQTKKIQDLVCEEHRSLNGSMEYIDQINGFPTSLCTFDGGKLNPFSLKHHKKINFMKSNLNNAMNSFRFNVSHGERWKLFGSENFLTKDKENFAVFGISKSKSDIQFPSHYSDCNVGNSGRNSSYSSGYNSLSNTLSMPNSDCCLLRSASDADGLNIFRNASAFGMNKECFKCTQGNILNSHYDEENSKLNELIVTQSNEGYDKITGEESNKDFTSTNELFKNMKFDVITLDRVCSSKINALNNENELISNIRRSTSTSNCSSPQKLNGNLLQNIKRLLLTTSLRKNSSQINSYETSNDLEQPSSFLRKNNNSQVNSYEKSNDLEQSSLLRINVAESINKMREEQGKTRINSLENYRNSNNDSFDFTWNEIKNMGTNEFLKNCLHTSQEQQEILSLYRQNGGKCLSYPNLTDLDQVKSINVTNELRSADEFDLRAMENGDLLDFTTLKRIENLRNSIKLPLQNRRTSENLDEAFYDFFPRYTDRTHSFSDEALINLESLLEYERKLSAPQGCLGKAKFLSKFLNDLERREQMSGTLDNSSIPTQRSNPRKEVKPPKRSKMEKKSQSFLQLLALKRIQDAEKELEKVERSNRVETEEEPESLLEALKTYGYKGVISQRFQNQVDEDEIVPLTIRKRRANFSTGNYLPDVSYYQAMDYDTTPYIYSTYDNDNLDSEMLNGISMRSLYDMYPSPKKNLPRQYIYDWLTANQNNEYSTTFRSDPMLEPEILNTCQESESPTYRMKENRRSLDEASSSEVFEFPKDPNANEKSNNHLHSTRYPFTEADDTLDYVRRERSKLHRTPSAPERYDDYTTKYATFDRNPPEDNEEFSSYARSDRNPLLRTASAPEEEKEESVQDRIWRKSFYSRFNNSVLSKKERSSFLDRSDSRLGFRDRSMTPFGITSRDKLERRSLSSKRSSKRRSSSSSDRTLDSGLERTATNTTLTNDQDLER